MTGMDMSSIDRMKMKFPKGIEVPKTITASGSSNFETGVDSLDPKSSKFLEIVQLINDLLQNTKGSVNVTVSGGASAVGKGNYDNQALADRRRDKTIDTLKKYPFIDVKRVKFIKGDTVVGTSTKKGSKEAEKEQFVKVAVSGTGSINDPIKGVEGDNTNVYRPDIFNFERSKKGGKDTWDWEKHTEIKRVCVQVPANHINEFKALVKEFSKSKGIYIPTGVYDIKPKK
jgi:hypothetical protein